MTDETDLSLEEAQDLARKLEELTKSLSRPQQAVLSYAVRRGVGMTDDVEGYTFSYDTDYISSLPEYFQKITFSYLSPGSTVELNP
jgi:hypothetical protein